MSNYNAIQLGGRNSHMRIPCNDKNIELFFREKLSILFSQCAYFVDKTRKIVRIEEEEEEEEEMNVKKSCVCSLVQIGFTSGTNALEPWPMGSPMTSSSEKQGTMRFYTP
jgi:hypothetical protein